MKKRSILCVLLVLLISCFAFVACNPREGSETGTYYNDDTGTKDTIRLYGGNKFEFLENNATKNGKYTLKNEALTLKFNSKSDGTIAATYKDRIVTIDGRQFLEDVNYTVTFDSGGGSNVSSASVLNGKLAAEPAKPTKSDFHFIGWYKDNNTFQDRFDFNVTRITGNITLYAYWVQGSSETEFTIALDPNYDDLPILSSIKTIGGKLYNLPIPARDGAITFEGWWVSFYDDGEKLAYPVTADTIFEENATIYAYWQQPKTGSKLQIPIVYVEGNDVRWNGDYDAISYKIEITGPVGFTAVNTTVNNPVYNVPFNTVSAGDYVIKVTSNAPDPSNSSDTRTIWYRNKALARVSIFHVAAPSIFTFNSVKNAKDYYITILCGTGVHSTAHTDLLLANNTFDFSGCVMPEDGIKFIVKARANGFAESIGEHIYKRTLAAIPQSSLSYNEQTETLSWIAVTDATGYVVSVECGNVAHSHANIDIGNKTSYCIKECPKGTVKMSVAPKALAWISPAASSHTHDKKTIASPKITGLNGITLKWNSIYGAVSYMVIIEGVSYSATTNEFMIDDQVTIKQDVDNVITVTAIAATITENSLPSDQFIVNTSMSELTYSVNTVYWQSVLGAESYHVSVNGGMETPIEADKNSAEVILDRDGGNTIEVRYFSNGEYSDPSSITVEAFTVTYEVNDYDSNVVLRYLLTGDKVIHPEVTFGGHTLVAWYTNLELTNLYNEQYCSRTGDFTLYAKWNANNYSGSYNYQDERSGTAVKYQVTFAQHFDLEKPVKQKEDGSLLDDGTAFIGWYTQPGGPDGPGIRLTNELGKSYEPWRITQDITLYAFWGNTLRFLELESDGTYAVNKTKYTENGISRGAIHFNLINNLEIPETYFGVKVSTIDSLAFSHTSGNSSLNLQTIKIPNTVMSIGAEAFKNCTNLTAINVYEVEGNNEYRYYSEDGVLYSDEKYYSSEESEIWLHIFPKAKTGDFRIPEVVSVLGDEVFSGLRNIKQITIPANVTIMGNKAFRDCISLETVIIEGKSLTYIALEAFRGCVALKSINLPEGLETIGIGAFRGCIELLEIQIPKTVTSIGNYAFADCYKLEEVFFVRGGTAPLIIGPSTLTAGDTTATYVFQNCVSLEEMVIVNRTTIIGNYAFTGCTGLSVLEFELTGEEQAELPLLIGTSNAAYTFQNCTSLEEVEIPKRVTTIYGYSFANCKQLADISFEPGGESLTIGNYAFQYCALTSFEVPLSVTSLSFRNVFYGCRNLSEITVADGHESFNIIDNVIYNGDMSQLIYAPGGLSGTLNIKDTVITINSEALRDCVNLEEVVIPTSVIRIGSNAFYNCSSLTSVTFEKGGLNDLVLADYAFAFCSKLTDFEIPARVGVGGWTYYTNGNRNSFTAGVGSNIFRYCISLENVTFEELEAEETPIYIAPMLTFADTTATNYDAGNFANGVASTFIECASLGEIVIPNRVPGLPSYMFQNSGLTKITIPASVTGFNNSTFNGCTRLAEFDVASDNSKYTTVEGMLFNKTGDGQTGTTLLVGTVNVTTGGAANAVIPDDTQIISAYAYRARPITSLTVPVSVREIGDYAFAETSQLTSITFLPAEAGQSEPDLTIGYQAFYGYGTRPKLQSLTLPARLKSIGNQAFYMLSSLKTLNFLSDDMTKPGARTLTIGNQVFSQTGIENLTIGANVIAIGDYSFSSSTSTIAYSDTLKSVSFAPNSVLDSLGQGVFRGDRGLTQIILPASLKKLGTAQDSYYGVFEGCSNLESVSFGGENSKLELIGGYSFKDCTSLTGTIQIPSTLKIIGNNAFQNAPVTGNIVIPLATTYIGGSAFSGSNLSGLSFELVELNDEDDGEEIIELDLVIKSSAFAGSSTVLVGYNKNISGSITIPRRVTAIESSAFQYLSGITSITIQEGSRLTASGIGSSAFAGTGISSITLPMGVNPNSNIFGSGSVVNNTMNLATINTTVNPNAPSNNKVIDDVFFSSDGKTLQYYPKAKTGSYEIPNGVTAFGTALQYARGLSKLTIPASAHPTGNINTQAFRGMTGLTEFALSDDEEDEIDGHPKYSVHDGVLYNKDFTILVAYPAGKKGPYTFPSSVIEIGDYAFADVVDIDKNNNEIKELIIPTHITTIGSNAFNGSQINKITFATMGGSNLTTLRANAFSYMDNVTSITIPYGITTITTNSTFSNNLKLESVVLPNSLTSTGTGMFASCPSLKSVTIPTRMQKLNNQFFTSCSALEEIVIPATVTSLGSYVFQHCSSLRSVSLPETITVIDNYTFQNCVKLTEIKLPTSLTSIGTVAFAGSGIKEIEIPNSVTTIGGGKTTVGTFQDCLELEKVSLSEQLTRIPYNMFFGCTKLTEIKIPESVTNIQVRAFAATGLKKIEIPYGVTEIGENAFTSDIMSGVNAGAFANCQSLESVSLPRSITKIWTFTFENCSALKSIELPSSIYGQMGTSSSSVSRYAIESYAFRGCTSLKELTIPANVNTINTYAFENCIKLEKVVIESGVEAIEGSVFKGCANIKTFVLSETIVKLGDEVFAYWTKEQTIYIRELAGEPNNSWGTYWRRYCDANIIWEWDGVLPG